MVDGSAAGVVEAHRESFGSVVQMLVPPTATLNGKVGNVTAGVTAARNEYVVLADDDVRYEFAQLEQVCALLRDAEVVRPQNYFSPCPWHARLDTARTLLNRVTGGDWPGTLGIRRSAFVAAGGYAGDVLFENLELVRTLLAFGGREHLALDVFVARRPPTYEHFRGQQVRQAYDEFARPARLALFLLFVPRDACCARGSALLRRRSVGRHQYRRRRMWPSAGRRRDSVSRLIVVPRSGVADVAVVLLMDGTHRTSARRCPVPRTTHLAGGLLA